MCLDCEIHFHQAILAHMEASPTVPCLDATWDESTKRGHLLFEDVSDTHYHGRGGIHAELQAESEQIVDAFAPFHAFWWDNPLLGTEVGAYPQEDSLLWYSGAAAYEQSLPRFISLVGDRLSKRRISLLERALASFPFKDLHGTSRLTPGNRLTLIHADAKYENILLPRDPGTREVYLIDWAFWEVRMGTDDIAHIGLYGFCEPRAELTDLLVRRYHDGLLCHGVQDYAGRTAGTTTDSPRSVICSSQSAPRSMELTFATAGGIWSAASEAFGISSAKSFSHDSLVPESGFGQSVRHHPEMRGGES